MVAQASRLCCEQSIFSLSTTTTTGETPVPLTLVPLTLVPLTLVPLTPGF